MNLHYGIKKLIGGGRGANALVAPLPPTDTQDHTGHLPFSKNYTNYA